VSLSTHTFLRQNRQGILASWEAAVTADRRDVNLAGSALRDHLPALLDELALWLESGDEPGTSRTRAAAAEHAAGRVRDAYQLTQLISELRLLRTTILRLLLRSEAEEQARAGAAGKERRVPELARLNAGLDDMIGHAVEHFVAAQRDELDGAERAARARETELRVSEARYRKILDSVDVGFCVIEVLFDPAGNPVDYVFEDVNRSFEQRTGLVNATGRRMRELAPAHEEHWFVIYGGVARTGEAIRFERPAEALGRWYDVYAFRLSEAGPNRVAVLFSDITERRRADDARRSTEAALDAFFASSPGILNLDDEELRYLKTDAITPTYFGLTRETVIGRSVKDVAPDFVRKFGPMMRRVIETGEPELNIEVESPVSSRPGETSYWRASYFPVPLPEGKRGLGVMGVEITDLKKAEAALRDADRRKDEFLGMLSHELRNPLAPIRNSIFLLERAAPGTQLASRALDVIRRQTDHLTRLVDDLLDVTRIARGRIELHRSRVDLREIVLHGAEDFRLLFQDRAVAFDVVVPAEETWSDADSTRITQVIGNLLHNASKFTTGGDRVTVTMEVVDGSAEVRVLDTGAGIDPALLPLVFDPCVQGARSLARTEGGLGLGLALVKGIAELHGGNVSVESAGPGHGAEFVVRLPLAAPACELRHVPSARLPKCGRRVLVVDDNADAAESLAEIARMAGHEVEVAYDGASALEKARSSPPDVILCDLGLPGMSGYDVARALRSTNGRTVQLIALSGYAQPEDVRKAVEAGFDAHVAKPPDLDGLMKLLAAQRCDDRRR
jgi:PAS domain S-box-containing protein